MHPNDLDLLVQAITDLVLARLRESEPARLKAAPPPATRPPVLTVLWPAPTSAIEAILAGVSAFRADGRRVRWLVREDLLSELRPLLPAEEQPRCHALGQAPVQAILADLKGTDVVLLAAAHFDAARRLLALDDGLDWVHVLLQAHLSGQPVLVCDDLLSSRGLAARSAAAQEAQGLARQLRQAGYRLLSARDLPRRFKEMTRAGDPGSQDAPGLLTEQDVENLVRAGHRELALHARTLVTPLAQSRAAELGLELLHTQDE
jgi:hypothetical protein